MRMRMATLIVTRVSMTTTMKKYNITYLPGTNQAVHPRRRIQSVCSTAVTKMLCPEHPFGFDSQLLELQCQHAAVFDGAASALSFSSAEERCFGQYRETTAYILYQTCFLCQQLRIACSSGLCETGPRGPSGCRTARASRVSGMS